MEWSLFEDLLCFLQKEELVLKALRATNLKACLRTGTGTKGYEANAERAKYCRIYNKIEKSVTADQKATLMDWERRLCSEAEDIDFARLLTILENRQDDLRQMQKTSLEACFNSSLSNTDKDLSFCRNFLRRKKTSMTDEQQKVVDEWEEIICADGAGLCPAIEADFARVCLLYWKTVKMTCVKCKKQVSKHVSGHVSAMQTMILVLDGTFSVGGKIC